jgi:hypothetical protein
MWYILNENNFNNKYFKLTLMNRLYPNDDKMSPEISVFIGKNSHEVITKTVQSCRRCCQYNNEGADEIIFSLFPTCLCYC